MRRPLRCPGRPGPGRRAHASERNDPTHLIFDEPDNYASRGLPTYIGPMNFPNLVFNVHVYCGARSPVTGNPTNVDACADQEEHSLAVRQSDRPAMASPAQPGGPGLDRHRVRRHAATRRCWRPSRPRSTQRQVSWTYWAWKYYGDPTGSAAESLVMADGRLRSTASVLSRAYPQAVAGTPLRFSFSPQTDVFDMAYVPNHRVARADAHFRADAGALPARLLRAHDRGQRHVGAGERPAARCATTGTGSRVTVEVTPGRCRPGDCGEPDVGWGHVPKHHHSARARARGHARGD